MGTAVVIGMTTNASLGSASCIISANWSFNPGRQDAYCLGEFLPSDVYTISKPQETLSITCYAPGPSYPTPLAIGCDNASTIGASVSPAACGGTIASVDGQWFVNSYNYSKNSKDQPAQESWSLQRWDVDGATITPDPVLRTGATGQSSGDTGISFSKDLGTSSQGSVSAGGMGTASTINHGIVSSIGGGSKDDIGQGSASIQYTPLYI